MGNLIFRAKVAAAAHARLKHELWFSGVCMDSVDDYNEDNFDEAVEQAILDTVYHDAPNSGF